MLDSKPMIELLSPVVESMILTMARQAMILFAKFGSIQVTEFAAILGLKMLVCFQYSLMSS